MPSGDQPAERLARVAGDLDAGGEQHDVGGQHDRRADEAELLADQGEDHVVVRLGDVAADGDVADALAGRAAGAEARSARARSGSRVSCSALGVVGEHRVDAVALVLLHERRQVPAAPAARCAADSRRPRTATAPAPANSPIPTIASRCHIFAPATNSIANSAGMNTSAVPRSGCLRISASGSSASANGGSRPVQRAVVGAEPQVPRQHHHERDLHQLRRLEADRAEVDPVALALDRPGERAASSAVPSTV